MRRGTNFHQIATTLATLGATSLAVGDLAAAPRSDLVVAHEVPHAVVLGEGDAADDEDKEKVKDRGKGEGDDDADAGDKKKKKKKKKEGSCGGHGGCGAGRCG